MSAGLTVLVYWVVGDLIIGVVGWLIAKLLGE